MRRTAAASIALVLTLGAAAACGDESGDGNGGGGEPIKVGHWAPLSGTAAANGKFEANGVKLAVDEINKNGGILDGRKIELVQRDDGGVPEQSVSVVRRLIEQDRVVALVGGILSTNTLAVKEVVKGRMLSMVTAAKAPAITDPADPMVKRVDSTLVTDTNFMAGFLTSHPDLWPCNKVFMIAEDTDYGKGDSGLYEAAWKKAGKPQVVALERYPFQSTDFSILLTKVKGSGADCLYVNGNIGEMTALLQQIASANITLPIFAATSNISEPMLKDAGPRAEGIVSGDVYVPAIDNPENKAFVSAYQAMFNAVPERQAAMGYEAMKIVLAAMDKAGSTDSAKVADAIGAGTWATVFGPMKFDAKGQSDMKPAAITVKNGKIEVLS
jgi:branched-chain amino acid transport system substrate-binding protein